MKNNGAFGNNNTRKNTLKGVQIAFFARKHTVRHNQHKKPTEANTINFLARRGYPVHLLHTCIPQL